MTVKNIFQVHAREEPDSRISSDSDSHPDNPFADPAVAERYAIIYEKAQYECRHVFDPELTWTPQEEKALVRKLDWHVCLWAVCYHHLIYSVYSILINQCVMFFGLQVDRGNLVQAVSDNLLDDLNLSTNGNRLS